MMRVQELMTKQVTTCKADDSLEHAAQMLWSHDCGCLPVTATGDNGVRLPIGMITDRDICMCAMFQHKSLDELHVRDAMSRSVLSCGPQEPVEHAEEIMREGQIRRLPVVDGSGCLIGMITLADIAREAAKERARPTKDVTETEVGDTLAAICAPPSQSLAA